MLFRGEYPQGAECTSKLTLLCCPLLYFSLSICSLLLNHPVLASPFASSLCCFQYFPLSSFTFRSFASPSFSVCPILFSFVLIYVFLAFLSMVLLGFSPSSAILSLRPFYLPLLFFPLFSACVIIKRYGGHPKDSMLFTTDSKEHLSLHIIPKYTNADIQTRINVHANILVHTRIMIENSIQNEISIFINLTYIQQNL